MPRRTSPLQQQAHTQTLSLSHTHRSNRYTLTRRRRSKTQAPTMHRGAHTPSRTHALPAATARQGGEQAASTARTWRSRVSSNTLSSRCESYSTVTCSASTTARAFSGSCHAQVNQCRDMRLSPAALSPPLRARTCIRSHPLASSRLTATGIHATRLDLGVTRALMCGTR